MSTTTAPIARSKSRSGWGCSSFVHDRNYGYGRNQQTCYREALAAGADVVIMVHPDYQYTPLLVTAMASMIAYGVYDVVLGSRIIGGTALRGGMPLYKYIANRLLTAFENLFLGVKLSEYHTGYRAFSREVLDAPAACGKTATISSSTTRCWRSAFISASVSAKSLARQNISRKLPLLISGAACTMDWRFCKRRFNLRCSAPALLTFQSSVKMARRSKPVNRIITRNECQRLRVATEDVLTSFCRRFFVRKCNQLPAVAPLAVQIEKLDGCYNRFLFVPPLLKD